MTTTTAPPAGPDATLPVARPQAATTANLIFAWSLAALFDVACAALVWASHFAWDAEATYIRDDQSWYGIEFFLFAAILSPAALAIVVNALVATYRSLRPSDRSTRARGSWIVYGLALVSMAVVCFPGSHMLEGAPTAVRVQAAAAHLVPVALVGLAALVGAVAGRALRR